MRVGVAKVIEDERTRSRDERRGCEREDVRGELNADIAVSSTVVFIQKSLVGEDREMAGKSGNGKAKSTIP